MGNPKQTIIEINGKKYDARTGKLVSAQAVPSQKISPTPKPKPAHKTVVQDIARPSSASQPARRNVQRSQTLMRSAVKRPAKPAAVKSTQAKRVSDITSVKPLPAKHMPLQANAARVSRAQKVERSKLVSKFGAQGASVIAHPIQPQIVTNRVEALPVRPAPMLKPHNPVESILEKGLKNATSHTQTLDKKIAKKTRRKTKRKSRLASYATGALAAVLLGGFIAYQNIPNISMRYAAARSGVQATLPGYQPAGFALSNHIQYNPGQITVRFASNTDTRQFSITQRETVWNSEALLSNYVSTKTDQIHKYEDKGRTIFLYGDNNATWVNGGVWYDIEGNSELNSDQLIRIATSM